MKISNLKRIISVVLLLSLCLPLAACGKKKDETVELNAYEKTIPAAVSPSSGVGRKDIKPDMQQQAPTGHTIVVDAGHGFMDGGCGEGVYEDGTLEKDINFAVASLLADRLKLLGYTVIMTHDGENLPAADTNNNRIFSATERVVYVNSLKDVDYLISIHVNSFDDSSVSGMHIYYQQSSVKVNDWGKTITEDIADAIHDEAGEPRPLVKDGTDPYTSFALTREVTIASTLLEIGFASNPSDAEKMVDDEWRETLANSIASGIDRFFKELDGVTDVK